MVNGRYAIRFVWDAGCAVDYERDSGAWRRFSDAASGDRLRRDVLNGVGKVGNGLGGILGNPVLLIGGAVVLLILIK